MTRLLSALLLVSALGQGADKPPTPYEDWAVCPREYCTYGEWTAQWNMKAYGARSFKSRVVFTVKADEKVTAITGTIATTSAGTVPFMRDVEIGTARPKAGDTAYLLTYQAGALWTVWFKGQAHRDVGPICEDYVSGDCVGLIVKPPIHIWWAQIRNAKGQIGWVAIDDDAPGAFDLHAGPEDR
jgi:hypothetical protein